MSEIAVSVLLQFEPVNVKRRGGTSYRITALADGQPLFVDTLDVDKAALRASFFERLEQKAEAAGVVVDASALERELLAYVYAARQELDVDSATGSGLVQNEPVHHEKLLNDFGIVVLGELENQAIAVYSTETKKQSIVKSPSSLRAPEILQLVGPTVADRLRTTENSNDEEGYSVGEFQEALALAAAEAPRIQPSDLRGQGVWPDDRGALLVDGAAAYIYNGNEIRRVTKPKWGQKIIQFNESKQWHGSLAAKVKVANQKSSAAVLKRLIHLTHKWNWSHPWDDRITAALIFATFIQALWRWRPLVSITGASDSGKSTFLQELLQPVLLPWTISADRSTEAGLRQAIGHDSAPVLIDEFDQYRHRQQVMELFRTSSRGGKILRGTADQTGQQFQVRHIPWFAAIESGDLLGQDRNRFIRLELQPPERRGELTLPSATALANLGKQAAVAALWAGQAAVDLADKIKVASFEGVHGRLIESLSVPAAMFAVLWHGRDVSAAKARAILWHMVGGRTSLQAQGEPDELQLLRDILAANLYVGCRDGSSSVTGEQSVEQLLLSGQYGPQLEAKGVRLVKRRHGGQILFLVPEIVRVQLLSKTRWSGSRIDQVLVRLPGAARDQQRSVGSRPWGISLPWHQCLETLAGQVSHQDIQEVGV